MNEYQQSENVREVQLDAEQNTSDPRADHKFRSRVMHRLHDSLSTPAEAPPSGGIPRVLVQYWDDLDRIPLDVAECMGTWTALAAHGFRIELFDDRSAGNYIAEHYSPNHVRAFEACPHPAMRSDYFRLCYMVRDGGFYVDADDVYTGADVLPFFRDARLKVQALCYDTVSDSMINPRLAPGVDRQHEECIYYANNNPLIARAHHPVLVAALGTSTSAILKTPAGRLDIQSMTGPGNLTLALTIYALAQEANGKSVDVEIVTNWDDFGFSQWPLDYRNDDRNWRLWHQGP